MVLIFADDSTVELVEGVGEVQRECEGPEVDAGVYRFFDGNGHRLNVVWDRPTRSGRFLGLIPWTTLGHYDLVREPQPALAELREELLAVTAMRPNRWFRSLDELKGRFEV
jgi:hypothetical protein